MIAPLLVAIQETPDFGLTIPMPDFKEYAPRPPPELHINLPATSNLSYQPELRRKFYVNHQPNLAELPPGLDLERLLPR